MKGAFSLIFLLCCLPCSLPAQMGIYQHGTVVRMRMDDCILAPHGFMAGFGSPASPMIQQVCPEYTLVSDNVVFLIVGKFSNQLIPLAETIDFRLHKNELAVRVDDAKRETRFVIKEMMVRSEWDRLQLHLDEQMKAPEVREAQR